MIFYASEFQKIFDRIPSEEIIRILERFITPSRIEKIEEVLRSRIHGIHVAVECPYDIHNAMAITRTAEAMGVHNVHVIDAEIRGKQGFTTSSGALRWIHLNKYRSLEQFQERFKDTPFVFAGACVDGDKDLDTLPLDRPICLLFGNEQRGLTPEAQAMCQYKFKLPMYGMVESYNLSVAAAISLYHLLEKKRKEVKGDLSEDNFLNEKAWCMIRSLGFQKAQSLLQLLYRHNGVSVCLK